MNDVETFVVLTARDWMRTLLTCREPSLARGIFELVITFVTLVALWFVIWLSYSSGLWWLSLLLTIPAAGFVVRLFMIQHGCGHGAFFRQKRANDWTGRVLGVLTFTPYDCWRKTHSIHHATSGNLERRGMGDIDTLTVDEYRTMSWRGRLRYRLYRHPAVMFGIGPAYLFIIKHRFPAGMMRRIVGVALGARHECCDRTHLRRPDLAYRFRRAPDGAFAYHSARRNPGRLAVLCAA